MTKKCVVVETNDGTKMTLTLKWKKDLSETTDLLEVHNMERAYMSALFQEIVNSMIANKIPFNDIKSITFPPFVEFEDKGKEK